MKKKAVLAAALASLIWSIYLTASVAINNTSVAKRVAGGQLHTFSAPLRLTYTVQALILIFEFFFLIQLFNKGGVWSRTTYLWARIFLMLSALSAVVQMSSKSSLERWNTLPAVVIAYGFLVLGGLHFGRRQR